METGSKRGVGLGGGTIFRRAGTATVNSAGTAIVQRVGTATAQNAVAIDRRSTDSDFASPAGRINSRVSCEKVLVVPSMV